MQRSQPYLMTVHTMILTLVQLLHHNCLTLMHAGANRQQWTAIEGLSLIRLSCAPTMILRNKENRSRIPHVVNGSIYIQVMLSAAVVQATKRA